MIFEFIQKILFMGTGYIFGLIVGLVIGVTGFSTILGDGFLFYFFTIATFIGVVSLFVLLRKDSKIERRKDA